jgi:threonine/homoserine/homoserine lactone efflux protein
MGTVIGDLLPLGIAVAISPVPIIAVVLILLSKEAGKTSVGFLIGWIAGIVLVTTIVLVIVGQTKGSPAALSTLSSVVETVLGVFLIALGVDQRRGRPKEGDEVTLPKWMTSVDSLTFGRALGLGFLLSGVNPKNLLILIGAAAAIGAGHLSAAGDIFAIVIFTVLAGCTVAAPIGIYLLAGERMGQPLTKLRGWLTGNTPTVMTVLIVIVGVVLIGKGIRDLTS